MKIAQYCSVCKQSLEMEVAPTADGDDDGVIWLRCPQCKGFLPRISGEGLDRSGRPDPASASRSAAQGTSSSRMGNPLPSSEA